jgi:hypothetical protein
MKNQDFCRQGTQGTQRCEIELFSFAIFVLQSVRITNIGGDFCPLNTPIAAETEKNFFLRSSAYSAGKSGFDCRWPHCDLLRSIHLSEFLTAKYSDYAKIIIRHPATAEQHSRNGTVPILVVRKCVKTPTQRPREGTRPAKNGPNSHLV